MTARTTITGRHVLTAMLAFFAAVILVNAAFVVLAVRSFPGEDVRRSYLQGLNYNATLAERRAARALGWRVESSIVATQSGAVLEARIYDAHGAPVDGLTLEGVLRRPAESGHDITLDFVQRGPGMYAAALPELAPGVWDLRAAAQRGAQRFSFTQRRTWLPQR